VLIVHPSVPARSVKDLALLAKARPGGMSYASGGSGTVGHLAAEMFASQVGAKLVNVAYRGTGPGVFSVVQGENDLMFCNLLPAMPFLKISRVRALGIASLTRSTLLRDVPTLHESGLPGFDVQQYYSLVAPAGTSGEIVSRLNQEIARHFQSPDVKSRLAGDGSEARVSTPVELEKLIVSEIAKWTRTIRQAGIRPD
jgi:tripartite-type tricarboxylate transporter receptor subunit TctC